MQHSHHAFSRLDVVFTFSHFAAIALSVRCCDLSALKYYTLLCHCCMSSCTLFANCLCRLKFTQAGGPKTGKYLPKETSGNTHGKRARWQPGPFLLEPTRAGFGKVSVLDHIRWCNVYFAQVRGLGNQKAPGLDGILNEPIKHLPVEVHQAIQKLFILMWMTGATPTAWKQQQSSSYIMKAVSLT